MLHNLADFRANYSISWKENLDECLTQLVIYLNLFRFHAKYFYRIHRDCLFIIKIKFLRLFSNNATSNLKLNVIYLFNVKQDTFKS